MWFSTRGGFMASPGIEKGWSIVMMPDLPPRGVYRLASGPFTYSFLSDEDPSRYEVSANYSRVPQSEVKALLHAHQAPLMRQSDLTAVLVDTGAHRILFDGGVGHLALPEAASTDMGLELPAAGFTGQILTNLQRAGIAPETITEICVTHLHTDHFWGLVTPAGQPAYPNAKVFCSRIEYERWSLPTPDLSQMRVSNELKHLLIQTAHLFLHMMGDRLHLLDPQPEQEVLPGIVALLTPGHTPGHLAYRVTPPSAGTPLLIVGDALEDAVISLASTWPCDLDLDPAAAATTQGAILHEAAISGTLVAAYHFPWPSVGRVEHTEAGYRWQALTREA
jgi:glyoxylase-like metal-dependent hydrolase (beta-lactamase superfamily II)